MLMNQLYSTCNVVFSTHSLMFLDLNYDINFKNLLGMKKKRDDHARQNTVLSLS